jgi:hypothetical protein
MNKRVCDTKVTHKQTGEVPGSSYSSSRSEPVNLGTSRATPAFFPLPNAAPDISSSFSCVTSLRLSGECGPCSCASQPPPRRSGCHRLYPGQVLPLPGGWLRPLNHEGLNRRIKQFGINPIGRGDNDPERPATPFNEEATFRAVFGPIGRIRTHLLATPARFSQGRISGLPAPINRAQFFTFLNQQRPDLFNQPALRPSLKGAMKGGVIPIDTRDGVPLAASAKAEDQPLKNLAGIFTFASSRCRWIEVINQFLNAFP